MNLLAVDLIKTVIFIRTSSTVLSFASPSPLPRPVSAAALQSLIGCEKLEGVSIVRRLLDAGDFADGPSQHSVRSEQPLHELDAFEKFVSITAQAACLRRARNLWKARGRTETVGFVY